MDVDDLPDSYYVLKMKGSGGFWIGDQDGRRLWKFIETLQPGDELKSFSFVDLAGSSIVILAGAISDLFYSTFEVRKLDKELVDRDYPPADKPF